MKKGINTDWPFDNGGYMSGRRLFDILMLKRRDEIDELMADKAKDEITEDSLKRLYKKFLSESVIGLTENEKKLLIDMEGFSRAKSGALFTAIEMTDWDIRIGSCCVLKGHYGVEASEDGAYYKKLDFLMPEKTEEIERIIRVTAIEETGKELTLSDPEVVKEGFKAMRSVRGEWGMMIKGRRGRKHEEHLL